MSLIQYANPLHRADARRVRSSRQIFQGKDRQMRKVSRKLNAVFENLRFLTLNMCLRRITIPAQVLRA